MSVHHRRFLCAALVLGALHAALPCHAADSAAALTLAEAQRRALERSRQLPAQDAAILAAREMAVAAGQLPDPVLKAGIDNLPVNGSDRFRLSGDFMTMRRIGLMQEVTRADKRQLKSERFEREAEKSQAEKEAAMATVERDTALAWIDRYYAEAMAAVIAEQQRQAQLEVEAADSAWRGGHGSQADVFAARSARVLLEDRASEINRHLRRANTLLARWIGDGAKAPLAKIPDVDTLRLSEDALETHLQNHPDIVALTRQEEIAATEARLALAEKKSDWSWEVAYQQRGAAYSNMVSVGVSIPLQWNQGNRQDRVAASRLALVDEARARRDEVLRAHTAEVRNMIVDWDNGRTRRDRYQRELLPLAKHRTQAALAAYRGGKARLAEVLAARRDELETQMQMLQLDQEIARWWAQLNFLWPTTFQASFKETK